MYKKPEHIQKLYRLIVEGERLNSTGTPELRYGVPWSEPMNWISCFIAVASQTWLSPIMDQMENSDQLSRKKKRFLHFKTSVGINASLLGLNLCLTCNPENVSPNCSASWMYQCVKVTKVKNTRSHVWRTQWHDSLCFCACSRSSCTGNWVQD